MVYVDSTGFTVPNNDILIRHYTVPLCVRFINQIACGSVLLATH